jgi:crotonobetaine/carnitine-CoA ligase
MTARFGGDEPTLGKILAERAASDPTSVAVRFLDGQTHTSGLLFEESSRVSAGLASLGGKQGDRVVIMCGNHVEFLWTFFGATMGAFVPVPLNTALRGDILTHMLADASPVAIVCDNDLVDDVQKSAAEAGCTAHIIVIGDQASMSFQQRIGLTDVMSHGQGTLANQSFSDLALINYTSGTTGRSKGVMASHRMAVGFADSPDWALNCTAEDIAFSTLPLFHVNGLFTSFLSSLRAGGHAVFAPRFSATAYWDQVRESQATLLSMLGSMTAILWNRPADDMDRDHAVRTAIVVPAPPADYYDGFITRFGFPLTEVYGLTDVGVPIAVPPGQARPSGYCGKAHPDWECQVVDEFDRPVPHGERGELVVRPRRPYLMQLGYWNRPDATLDAWRNLWFHTGDVFEQNAGEWFRFVDRAKDSIRRSGENVSAFEVESVIASHPAVQDVAVYPVPSELSEEEIMAAVTLKPSDFTIADLAAFCAERLPYFAVPRYIEIMDDLPRTETAKIRKSELRSRGISDATIDFGRPKRPKQKAPPRTSPAL